MDHDRPSSSQNDPKSGEKKPQTQTSNLVWYMLGIGVLSLLALSIWGSGSEENIAWSDFIRLVEASDKQDPTADGHVIVKTGTDDKPQEVVLSNLRKVKIGVTEITAEVTRRLVEKEKAKEGGKADSTDAGSNVNRAEAPIPTADTNQNEKQPKADARTADADDAEDADINDADTGEEAKTATDNLQGRKLGKEEEGVILRVARSSEEKETARLLFENNVDFEYSKGPKWWMGYLPILLMTGLFAFLIIMMIRRMGGAGSPMAFGRSRGKLFSQEDIEVTFDDVAGIDEAVEELREVVEFLKTPDKFQSLGGRIPKGVLLVGPPGTGKTLLAKAIAGEASVPFYSLSGSDFVEMFVGVGAARVRDMFQQAEARAPCILFIDELDALGKTRGSGQIGGHDEREQTLNALLVEMDGFATNSGTIVIAATNRPETLDPALLRPGRFDRHVLVDRPDVAGRERILRVHLKEIKVDESVDVKSLAAITSGFVGADLANLVNEAALLAAREGKEAVTMTELDEAVERSAAGLEKKSRIIQEDEKLRVAYHESGHALVAYSLPNTDPVHKVSIIPRGLAALGYTMQRPDEDRYLMTQGELESRIQVLLAGTVTEEMIFDDISTGAQNDLERATEIARSMVMDYGMSRLGRVNYRESNRSPFLTAGGDLPAMQHHSEQTAREIDEEVKRITDDSLVQTRKILERRKDALVAVTQALLEHEVIDSGQLTELIEKHSPGPMIAAGTEGERKPSARPSQSDADVPSPTEPARASGDVD